MKKNSRTKNSFYNILFSIIYSTMSLITGFIIQTLIIKCLSIEYVGMKSVFSNILGIISIVELDISYIFIYNLYKPISDGNVNKIKQVVNYFKKIYQKIFITILLLGILFIPFIKYFIYNSTIKENIYILYLIYLLNTAIPIYLSYKKNILYAYQQEYISLVIQIIYQTVKLVLYSIMIFKTHNYYYISIIVLLLQTIEYLVISRIVDKKFKFLTYKKDTKLSKKDIVKIREDTYSIGCHKISSVIVNNTDNILISLFYGIKITGICSNYFMIIDNIKLIFNKVISSLAPSVGDFMCSQNDKEKRYDIFKKIHFLNMWIAIYISVIIINCINIFIEKWIGSEYLLNDFILIIFVINYFQSQMRACYMVFKNSAGIYTEDKYIALFEAFINIILSIIFTYIFGLSGIIVGTLISSLVLWLYTYPVLIFKKLFNINYKKYIIHVLKSVVLMTSILLINNLLKVVININNNLFLNAILSIVIPTFCMLLLDYKKQNIKYFYNLIKRLK